MNINGGVVKSGTGRVGRVLGSGGEVTISGGSWETNELFVGDSTTASMTISSGGLVWSHDAVIGSGGAAGGSVVTATGRDSQMVVLNSLTVGDLGSNNRLVVRLDALVKVGDSPGDTLVFSARGSSGNVLRLDGGYVALFGDQTGYVTDVLLANGNIQLWNGIDWVTATGNPNFRVAYFSNDLEAFAATGYEHLGGYTILMTVPEPNVVVLIVLGVAVIVAFRFRKVCG